jgi:hypothetical protein
VFRVLYVVIDVFLIIIQVICYVIYVFLFRT